MLSSVDKNIFLKSPSVNLTPFITAEWNQNIFNSPYITVAGDGTKKSCVLSPSTPKTVSSVTDSNKHPHFDTLKYTMDGTDDYALYSITAGAKAYKIITYVTTDSDSPIIVNANAKGGVRQHGSASSEINSFGWTKLETYIGSPENISSISYALSANKLSTSDSYGVLYFTKPEVYETTYFDYQYGSVFDSNSAFSGFRPGESYVTTGSDNFSLPTDFRKVTTSNILKGKGSFSMPTSPLFASPNFFMTSTPTPIYKHALLHDISPYKYFVSDQVASNSLTGIYANPILMNKLVLKFNTYLSTPTVNITLTLSNGNTISKTGVTPSSNGTVTLYISSNSLSSEKWATVPYINDDGSLSNSISINKVTVTQTSSAKSSDFSTTNQKVVDDATRMHVIEVSPRLELDMTPYVIDVQVNKALDAKDTYMPISSLVTDDASITLSGIPLGNINTPVPVFSNISNYSTTKLNGLLRKNVKFYIFYKLNSYVDSDTNVEYATSTLIPNGVFYSDEWQQNDIDTISVPCFDVTRYLQSVPASDYVSNMKDAFSVITNILDLTGFTDYDIDSLYSVCNDKNVPINMNYYFCNSKDTTLADALNQIFLPYQIGAYIDNYGVMKFLSLSNIMKKVSSFADFSIDQSGIIQNGYSVSNKAKPGKISLRYTTPRIKQSLSLQNVKDIGTANGPGYVYTTSNDVLWQQQSVDAVGLNYLAADMNDKQNYFSINQSDLLDAFHTFNLSTNGYAAIEDEIVSFVYKEYTISKTDSSIQTTVSVKNDLELAEAVNRFISDNQIGLVENYGSIISVTHSTVGGLGYNTYEVSGTSKLNTFSLGDFVTVSGMNPDTLNISAQVTSTTGHTFTVRSDASVPMLSGGEVTKGMGYDILIIPTGNITNLQRGLFGTNVAAHTIISSGISSKGLTESVINSGTLSSSSTFSVDSAAKSILSKPVSSGRNIIYSSSESDQGYNTYMVKFNFDDQVGATVKNLCSAGLFFNLDTSNPGSTYYLEMVRYNSSTTATPSYKYLLVLHQEGHDTTAYVDVTSAAQTVKNNFEQLYVKNSNPQAKDGSDAYNLYNNPHETFNLRFTAVPYTYEIDGEGEPSYPTGYTMQVFLNNYEITGWQQYINGDWVNTNLNNVTGLRKKVRLAEKATLGRKFGAFTSSTPVEISPADPNIIYPTSNYTAGSSLAYIREIYATEKVLKERSVNYYFQDREFLNGLIQGERLFANYKEYIMQTQPTIVGINTYDVQYTNGAAVSADILPVEYSWLYFPGNTLIEQQYIRHQLVDEYSVSYSTPLNTGFRAKFAIANNSSHMVYLKKDSDELNQFVVNLNLWTHEVIVPSDPENLEHVIDGGNILETMQIDSSFIQSRDSAEKLLKLVGHSIDNFSKDVSLNIYGNPLIEVGDVVTVSYPLLGVNQQKYIVHSVSNSFNNGLSTKLTLNMINRGISV